LEYELPKISNPFIGRKVVASSSTHDVPWITISGAAAVDSRGGMVDAAARTGAAVAVDPSTFGAPAAEEDPFSDVYHAAFEFRHEVRS
jgi:hypothetical protein